MAHFPCCVVAAVHDFAVDDNAAADTGAERNRNEVFHVTARARDRFAERRTVGVIFEINRLVKIFRQNIPRGDFIKAEVVRIFDNTEAFIHGARCADTDRRNFVHGNAGVFDGFIHANGDIRQNFLCRTRASSFAFAFADDFIKFVHNTRNNIGSA